MLTAPPLTLDELRKQLETETAVRLPATEADYFALLEAQADDIYLEFDTHHLVARPNMNTENHELITASVIHLLVNGLLDKPDYRVLGSNRPVYVVDCALGFAPDVLVIKGPTELYPRQRAMAATLNPWLLVEVMSESNRGEAFQHKLHCYKQIPALQHILLIEQDEMLVSSYTRTDRPNQWLNTDYFRPDETVTVGDLALPIVDVYRNVIFAD